MHPRWGKASSVPIRFSTDLFGSMVASGLLDVKQTDAFCDEKWQFMTGFVRIQVAVAFFAVFDFWLIL
jgi:hypothetical protein